MLLGILSNSGEKPPLNCEQCFSPHFTKGRQIMDIKKIFGSVDKEDVLHTKDGDEFPLSPGLAKNVREQQEEYNTIGIDTDDKDGHVKSVRTSEWRRK